MSMGTTSQCQCSKWSVFLCRGKVIGTFKWQVGLLASLMSVIWISLAKMAHLHHKTNGSVSCGKSDFLLMVNLQHGGGDLMSRLKICSKGYCRIFKDNKPACGHQISGRPLFKEGVERLSPLQDPNFCAAFSRLELKNDKCFISEIIFGKNYWSYPVYLLFCVSFSSHYCPIVNSLQLPPVYPLINPVYKCSQSFLHQFCQCWFSELCLNPFPGVPLSCYCIFRPALDMTPTLLWSLFAL